MLPLGGEKALLAALFLIPEMYSFLFDYITAGQGYTVVREVLRKLIDNSGHEQEIIILRLS